MVNLFLFCFFFLYPPPHIFFSSLVGAAEAAKVAAEGALVGWGCAIRCFPSAALPAAGTCPCFFFSGSPPVCPVRGGLAFFGGVPCRYIAPSGRRVLRARPPPEQRTAFGFLGVACVAVASCLSASLCFCCLASSGVCAVFEFEKNRGQKSPEFF